MSTSYLLNWQLKSNYCAMAIENYVHTKYVAIYPIILNTPLSNNSCLPCADVNLYTESFCEIFQENKLGYIQILMAQKLTQMVWE